MTEQHTDKDAEARSPMSELWETVVIIAQALVIALVIRTFLIQNVFIPTGSLQPTLLIGDYVAASKYSWGYGQHSFPFGLVPFDGRIFGREPNRGDIAVFYNAPTGEDYVKRIIGLPGERIQVKEGRLYINGEIVPREMQGLGFDTDSRGNSSGVVLYTETLPNGVSHTIQEVSDNGYLDNTEEYVVPEGHYFMMGDNRDNSSDSRVLSQVGYVPADNLIGKGEFTFFSLKDNVAPWKFWLWPSHLRLDRMFTSVYDL